MAAKFNFRLVSRTFVFQKTGQSSSRDPDLSAMRDVRVYVQDARTFWWICLVQVENKARVSDAFEIKLRGPCRVSGARSDDGFSERRRRIEDRPHKDPLSFCFQPHENRKRGETTKSLSLLNSFADNIAVPSRFLSGTDALMELSAVPLLEETQKILW